MPHEQTCAHTLDQPLISSFVRAAVSGGISLIPMLGNVGTAAVAAADMRETIAEHRAFESTWVAAMLELQSIR